MGIQFETEAGILLLDLKGKATLEMHSVLIRKLMQHLTVKG